VRCGSPEDDDLLAEKNILGQESGAGAEYAHENPGEVGHQFMDDRGRASAEVGAVGIRSLAVTTETLEFHMADRVLGADNRVLAAHSHIPAPLRVQQRP
jgi:hypothetical protein